MTGGVCRGPTLELRPRIRVNSTRLKIVAGNKSPGSSGSPLGVGGLPNRNDRTSFRPSLAREDVSPRSVQTSLAQGGLLASTLSFDAGRAPTSSPNTACGFFRCRPSLLPAPAPASAEPSVRSVCLFFGKIYGDFFSDRSGQFAAATGGGGPSSSPSSSDRNSSSEILRSYLHRRCRYCRFCGCGALSLVS